MNQDLIVSKSIDIQASIDAVWEGMTNPEIIKKYLYGTETVTTWEPGSEIVFQGEYSGQTYRDHGVVLEFTPKSKISYSYWSGFSGLEDKPENYSTVTYEIMDKSNGLTELTWIQKGYANEDRHKHSLTSMPEFLAGIKKTIEESALSST